VDRVRQRCVGGACRLSRMRSDGQRRTRSSRSDR
jgi:hypothetical protein